MKTLQVFRFFLQIAMENDFFGICIPLAKTFRIMPDLAPRSSRIKFLDKIYAFFIYFLALFCHITELFKLYQIVTGEYFILDEFIRNYTVTSFHFTTLIKIVFIKGRILPAWNSRCFELTLFSHCLGQISKRAFREIMDFEKAIYKSVNKDIHQLYKTCIIPVQNSRMYYLAGFVLVVAFYLAAPLFRGRIFSVLNHILKQCWIHRVFKIKITRESPNGLPQYPCSVCYVRVCY